MTDETAEDWHPLEDAAVPDIPPALRMLETKWEAEVRRLDAGMAIGWAFVRKGRHGVSFMEFIATDKSWSELALEGVTVRPEVWAAARALCGLTKLPFMVVVDAADNVCFTKVTDFGPEGAPPQRLMIPVFRPA